MALNLYQKLFYILQQVKAVKKTGKMNFGGGYTYASSSDILEPIRDAIVAIGLVLIPRIKKIEVRDFQTKDKNGNEKTQFFTILHMEYTWINVDNPTETAVSEWAGTGIDDFEKGLGKALTYSQKYFFSQTFLIDRNDDDPDANQYPNDHDYNSRKQPAASNYQKDSYEQPTYPKTTPFASSQNSPITQNGNGQNGNGKSSNQPVHYENEDEVVYQDRCRLFNKTIAYMEVNNISPATVKAICKELCIKQDSLHMSSQQFVQLLNTLQKRQEALKKQQAAKDAQEHALLIQEETASPPVNNDPPAPFTPPTDPFEATKEEAKKN